MLSRHLLEYLPFIAPLYLWRFQLGPLPTTFLEMYIGFTVLVFLYEQGREGLHRGWSRLTRFHAPLLTWLAVTFIAVLASPSLWTGFGLWRAYVLEPAIIFFILHAVSSSLDKRIFMRNLFIVTLLVTLYALIQFLTGYGIPHPWNVAMGAGRRATGPFPYPNALALFVVPIGAYALTEIVSRIESRESNERSEAARGSAPDSTARYLAPAALIASFLAVLLAKSDGGLIALGAVTWLALFFQRRLRWWLVSVTLLGVFIAALIPAIRMPLVHELTFQGWSGKVRMYMWRDTKAMLKDHWLFGAGFGGYPTVFKSYQRTTGIEVFQYPHNILLNFWSETGILGVLAFAWIILTTVSSIRTHDSYARYFFLVAILIHGLVDVPYFKNDLALLFWVLVWLTCSQTDQAQLSSPNKTPI